METSSGPKERDDLDPHKPGRDVSLQRKEYSFLLRGSCDLAHGKRLGVATLGEGGVVTETYFKLLRSVSPVRAAVKVSHVEAVDSFLTAEVHNDLLILPEPRGGVCPLQELGSLLQETVQVVSSASDHPPPVPLARLRSGQSLPGEAPQLSLNWDVTLPGKHPDLIVGPGFRVDQFMNSSVVNPKCEMILRSKSTVYRSC